MALTNDRTHVLRTEVDTTTQLFPVAADTAVWSGAIIGLNAAGEMVPGSLDPAVKILGVATTRADNRGGIVGGAFVSATFGPGSFWLKNDTNNPVLPTAVKEACYVFDDETVSADNTGPLAGTVMMVDNIRGVLVDFK